MSSWFDRNWLSNRTSVLNSSSDLTVPPSSRTLKNTLFQSDKRKKYGYSIADSPSMKLMRWSKSYGTVGKLKHQRTSLFSEKSLLRSSILEKPCTVKIVPPRQNLMNYSMNAMKKNAVGGALNDKLLSPFSRDKKVISTLNEFDSRSTVKRTRNELNEIFETTSGAVKKRRKTTEQVGSPKPAESSNSKNGDINGNTSKVEGGNGDYEGENKSFWRDAALLASLSTSRKWLTEEMNKTISAAYDTELMGATSMGVQNDALGLSRCTTPDSVQGSDVSNSSTFQKSAQSNSIIGENSRPSSLINYSLNSSMSHQPHLSHPNVFSQVYHPGSTSSYTNPPFNFQPVKIILREVSTNTDSDWTDESTKEKEPPRGVKKKNTSKQLSSNGFNSTKQITQSDLEKDDEFENERVRRLLGIETPSGDNDLKSTPVSSLSSQVSMATLSNTVAPTLSASLSKPLSFETSSAPPTSSQSVASALSSNADSDSNFKTTVNVPKIDVFAKSDLPAAAAPVVSLFNSTTNATTSSFSNSLNSVKSSPSKVSFNFGTQPTLSRTDEAKFATPTIVTSTSSSSETAVNSLFSNINANSAVVPPKTMTGFTGCTFGSNLISLSSSVKSTTANQTVTAASVTTPAQSFSFGSPKSQPSDTTFKSSMPNSSLAFSSNSSASTGKATDTATSSAAATLPSFSFSSTSGKSVNFASNGVFTPNNTPNSQNLFATQSTAAPATVFSTGTPVSSITTSVATGPALNFKFGSSVSSASPAFGQNPSKASVTQKSESQTQSIFGQNSSSTNAPFTFGAPSTSSTSNFTFSKSLSTPQTSTPSTLFASSLSTSNATSAVPSLYGSSSTTATTSPATAVSQVLSGGNIFGSQLTTSVSSASTASTSTASIGLFKFGATGSNPLFSFGGGGGNSVTTTSSQSTPNPIFGASLNTFSNNQFQSQGNSSLPFGGTQSISSASSSAVFGGAAAKVTPTTDSGASIFGSSSSLTSAGGGTLFGSQTTTTGNIFGASKASAPVFGATAAVSSAPAFGNSAAQPGGNIFGTSSTLSSNSNPIFGSQGSSSSLGAITGGSSGPTASFVFGQNAGATSNTTPTFNFGAPSGGITFGSSSAVPSTTDQQQGIVNSMGSGSAGSITAPDGGMTFSVGTNSNADSSLPNRRIRTATRKGAKTVRK